MRCGLACSTRAGLAAGLPPWVFRPQHNLIATVFNRYLPGVEAELLGQASRMAVARGEYGRGSLVSAGALIA